MDDAPPTTLEDTRFGAITVRLEGQERVEIEGPGIPPVSLVRAPGSEADPQIRIGTRDPEHLTLTIDGRTSPLLPAKGRLTRSSYRVEVEHEGARYVLVPDSVPGSRLTRDGTHLGDFTADGDALVIAEWQEHVDLRPLDASVGYALAAAFGTGAQPMWMMIVDGVSSALP
ncbi:hypothetical protein [Streptomyces sp. NPDC093093]|uniref:hypothetical protein n=1 Tax=Streptomyces sp. NPDC093093 TaxID=3366025 RepID=UPI003823FA19